MTSKRDIILDATGSHLTNYELVSTAEEYFECDYFDTMVYWDRDHFPGLYKTERYMDKKVSVIGCKLDLDGYQVIPIDRIYQRQRREQAPKIDYEYKEELL